MIYTHAAAALMAGAVAFGVGWQAQGWRLGEQIASIKAAQSAALAGATAAARAQEQTRFKGVQDAQVTAAKNAQSARTAAAAARAESRSLRDDIAAAERLSSQSLAACNQHAAAVGRLLDQCAGDYQEMAGVCQGHANDVRLLLDAAPK